MNFKKNKNINGERKALTVFNSKLFFCIVLLSAASTFLAASTAKAEYLGEKRFFLIDSSYDYNERPEIEATLKKIGFRAYFYVENQYYDNLSDNLKSEFDSYLNSLAGDFDSIIYPKMRDAFGYEWIPGIDNDDRITILFTKTKENVGGYFNPNDEYPKDEIVDGRSNEREMIYLNAAFIGNERIKSFLAHEFQHMITWYHKTKLKNISDDIWLNEARSEYASTAIGYDDNYPASNLKARVDNFTIVPTDSLTEWQNRIYDYSSVNLFSQYVADQFGKIIFKAMIENDKVGIESINKALADLNYSNSSFKDFRDIFTNWTVANYLNDKTLSSGAYGYKNLNLSYQNFHADPTNSYTMNDYATINSATMIKDWSSKYYEFKATEDYRGDHDSLKIDFDGENTGKFSVPYIVFYKNGAKKVDKLNLDNNQDSKFYFDGFGKDISSVVLIPNSQKQEAGFGNNNSSYYFSILAKMVRLEKYPDGSILRSVDDSKVYLIESGKKRWITSAFAFASKGYKWEDIILVLPNELELFENGENISSMATLRPDGSLIKGSEPKVYLIESGKKRWITSAFAFASKGYRWEDIDQLSDEELSLYPDGESIGVINLKPNGTLIKGSGPKVYLVEGGQKRWIATAEIFVSKRYNWDKIIVISDGELGLYLDGENIE